MGRSPRVPAKLKYECARFSVGSSVLTTAIFAWLHIASAVAWMGGGIMFAMVISPALERLSLQGSGGFLVKVAPGLAVSSKSWRVRPCFSVFF